MSISFVRAKAISRGAGQSAVACSAYRSCEREISESAKKVFNYTRKTGLIAKGLHCPEGVTMKKGELWNLVERTENRKDSRLAKEFIVAMPHELPENELKRIAERIAEQLATGDRFADWAIHQPSSRGDDRNIHAHFMITERAWNREMNSFEKKKNREWNTEEYLQIQKEAIAEICNERLRAYNLQEIDPRRYMEKIEAGLDVSEPQKHKGVIRTNYERNQVEKLERIQNEINKLEGMGYGNTERGAGFDRPDDRGNRGNEKGVRSELGADEQSPKSTTGERRNEPGSLDQSQKSTSRPQRGVSKNSDGYGYGD